MDEPEAGPDPPEASNHPVGAPSSPSPGVAEGDAGDSSEATVDDRPVGDAPVTAVDATNDDGSSEAAMMGLERKGGGGGPIIVGGRKPASSSSKYHGVTRHRWSGKYEAHLWDSTCRVEGRRRKGKQVYLVVCGNFTQEVMTLRIKQQGRMTLLLLNTGVQAPG